MTETRAASWPELADDLEEAHAKGVRAAASGLADPALDALRLAGPAVRTLAEAAVSSATPFLGAPLLARIRPCGGSTRPPRTLLDLPRVRRPDLRATAR
jgi:hypothetical protein